MGSLKNKKTTKIAPVKKLIYEEKQNQKEIRSLDDKALFKLGCIFVFLEKIVESNVQADPIKSLKKQKYLFIVAIQKLWDTLPDSTSLSPGNVSVALHHILKIIETRENVCIRSFLNACLVLLDEIKTAINTPNYVENVGMAEKAILGILEHYDPLLEDKETQEAGKDLALEILDYLEKSCI